MAGALRGMSAVAAGMVIGTALRLAPALRANPMGVPACIAFAALTFVWRRLLRVPLVWVSARARCARLRARLVSAGPGKGVMSTLDFDHLSADQWLTLLGHFLLLSLLSIGGAIVVAPDMHRVMVDRWR